MPNIASHSSNPISRANAVRIFVSFAAGYFLSYALRSVNAALAPLLASDLSLSAGELGWLSSAFFLSFAAMQLPLGIWLDRHGARRTESYLLIIAAIGALVVAAGQSLLMISIGRIMIGIGVSACLMAPYAYFRRSFASHKQAQLALWMLIAGTSGALFATQPALALAEWIGWRPFFVLSAGLLASVAAAIYFMTGDHDLHHNTPLTADQPTSLISLLRHPIMLRVIPTTIFFAGGFAAFQSLWAGPWMTEVLGMSPVEASEKLLFFNAALLVSYIAMSFISPRLEKRGIPLASQSVAAFFWFLICGIIMLVWRAYPSWIMWLVFTPGVPAVILMQTQTALAYPKNMAGRVLTTFNLVMFAGVFVIQWGVGLLTDMFKTFGMNSRNALTSAFLCLVICQCVSLFFYFWKKTPKTAATDQAMS